MTPISLTVRRAIAVEAAAAKARLLRRALADGGRIADGPVPPFMHPAEVLAQANDRPTLHLCVPQAAPPDSRIGPRFDPRGRRRPGPDEGEAR